MKKACRVISDSDINEACLWRLAEFSADSVESSTMRVAQLVEADVILTSDQPEVAAAMATLKRPGDRRGEWTALMAVIALYADSQGYARLFLVAGFEVVTAWKNARARAASIPKGIGTNALETIMIQSQASKPTADANSLFDTLTKLPRQHPAIRDYDPDSDTLTYDDRGCEREITRTSFERQFRKVRKNISGLQRDAVGSSCRKKLYSNEILKEF